MSKVMRITDRHLVHEYVGKWLEISRSDDFRGCLFVPREYEGQPARPKHVIAAVGYNNFVGKCCNMHVIIHQPEYLTREYIREAFEFPFIVCGLEHVLGPVDAANEPALEFDRRLGFTEKFRLPGGSGTGNDLVILSMAKKDCRWIRKEK